MARGQYFISIVLLLEFSPSVLSRLATSLFTFGGQAVSPRKRSMARLCSRESEGGIWDSELKLTHGLGAN